MNKEEKVEATIQIVIRPDGQVMFGSLTTAMAEVARVLAPNEERLQDAARSPKPCSAKEKNA